MCTGDADDDDDDDDDDDGITRNHETRFSSTAVTSQSRMAWNRLTLCCVESESTIKKITCYGLET